MEILFRIYLGVIAGVIMGGSFYSFLEYGDGNKNGAKFGAWVVFASPLWPVMLLAALVWIGVVEPLGVIRRRKF